MKKEEFSESSRKAISQRSKASQCKTSQVDSHPNLSSLELKEDINGFDEWDKVKNKQVSDLDPHDTTSEGKLWQQEPNQDDNMAFKTSKSVESEDELDKITDKIIEVSQPSNCLSRQQSQDIKELNDTFQHEFEQSNEREMIISTHSIESEETSDNKQSEDTKEELNKGTIQKEHESALTDVLNDEKEHLANGAVTNITSLQIVADFQNPFDENIDDESNSQIQVSDKNTETNQTLNYSKEENIMKLIDNKTTIENVIHQKDNDLSFSEYNKDIVENIDDKTNATSE